ncbi:hypothetical protein CEY12_02265 [Chryseobacterium sp. T16E-39]|nr:hypothetical protein CEY12_02265 [Chryseobacterium sp. T16E-39]
MSYAQVAIGKETITNTSTLLEFGSDAKGIILPSVDSAPDAVGGTFIVNTSNKAVEYNNGNDWISLTEAGNAADNPYVDVQTPDRASNQGLIIGANSSSKPGVLVLESSTRAMILPKVTNPQNLIKSPVSGTLVYDTASDSLAVCDGKNWFFWQ